MEKIKTIDVEIALMRKLKFKQKIIVPNISYGIANLHDCDLLVLSKAGYATEIEIKVSKADLLNDKNKSHGHYHNHIKNFYFAVPEKLKKVAFETISKRAGLYVVYKRNRYFSVQLEKKCVPNKKAHKWTKKERHKLACLGTMRIFSLKKRIQRAEKRKKH